MEPGDFSDVGVALGDLDQDGDIDAFTAVENGPNYVWINQLYSP